MSDDDNNIKQITVIDNYFMRLSELAQKNTQENEISEEVEFQIISYFKAIVERFNKKDAYSIEVIMNRLCELIEENSPIPYIEDFFTLDIINISLSYYEEEYSEESSIASGKFLSLISAQSNKYTLAFKNTDILHFLYDKINENKPLLVKYGLDIAKNMLFEDSIHQMFQDFYINEICAYCESEFHNVDECLSTLHFFVLFIMHHIDNNNTEKYHNIQQTFLHINSICGEKCHYLLLEAFIWLTYYDVLDFRFFFINGFGMIVCELFEKYPTQVIYFYSLCYIKIPDSRSSCPINIESLFHIIYDDQEKNDKYMEKCAASFFFLASYLSNDGIISENDLIKLTQFILQNIASFSLYMSKTAFVLLNEIMNVLQCSENFYQTINLFELFEVLNECISLDLQKESIARSAQVLLNIAHKCDELSIDIKPPVAQSSYIVTLETIFDSFESDEYENLFSTFINYFNN